MKQKLARSHRELNPSGRVSVNRTVIITASITILLTSTLSSLSQASRIDRARGKFDGALEKIEAEHVVQMRKWSVGYLSTLKHLKKSTMEQGDLDALETVDREISRFSEDQSLNVEHIISESGKLERIQKKYSNMRAEDDRTRHRNIIKLRDSYVALLAKMQRTLTRKGDVEGARNAKDEVARVNASEIVTSAEFVLAYSAVQEAEQTSSEDEPSENTDETFAENRSSEGVMIYAPGKIPPRQEGLKFRRKSLSRTKHSPMNAGVSVSLQEANQLRQIGHKARGRYWKTRTDSKTDHRRIRLGIRASGSATPPGNLEVYIQHYSKAFGQGSGDPALFSAATAYLPTIESRQQHVDFPPVLLSKHSSTSRSHSDRLGDTYYGCIVCVFNQGGELLYQGVTAPQLKQKATPTMPDKEDDARSQKVEDLKRNMYEAEWAWRGDYNNNVLQDEYRRAQRAYENARGAR